MTRILLIGGSPLHPCPNHTFLDYAKYLLENQSKFSKIKIDTLLVRNLLAEDLAFGRYSSPALFYPKQLVEDADAIIIGSPIAKSAYTGLLKSFLDLLPRRIFAHKVILPLATSHTIAHASALEYSLKPVLTELGATQILPSVFAVDDQIQDAEHSNLEITIRLQAALQDLLQAIAPSKNANQNNPSPLLDEIYAVH
ncbi:NAD(P)H-dependent oxidoreductase [Pseudanabaena sp. ABRG5-3]|uniref:NAD(P)H-dependent oxidoreductase n=1 Tax=Pseudanabaena sp. ABRG5-3 TaxID=685565 RepID=UPI000DC73EA1|nr:NAD(P)H-dependent oxidoreductase [Pseudanabaena sp. ABRG5-3]BBC26899.1 NADPH-dependent FMN reductase [Pseudanabaena sp. ABRG5-3]